MTFKETLRIAREKLEKPMPKVAVPIREIGISTREYLQLKIKLRNYESTKY